MAVNTYVALPQRHTTKNDFSPPTATAASSRTTQPLNMMPATAPMHVPAMASVFGDGGLVMKRSNKYALSSQQQQQQPPPPTQDRVNRTSFSSVKENGGAGAQSFTDTRISSYMRNEYFVDVEGENAVEDSDASGQSTPADEDPGSRSPGMLNPHSPLQGMVCPCDGFRGWKSISVKGRMASKSFGDLAKLKLRWEWHATPSSSTTDLKEPVEEESEPEVEEPLESGYPAGRSPLESLPIEILGSIIDQLATDIPPNGFTARNIDLISLLLTSRGLHSATLATLYSTITIPHSRIFRKFLNHVADYESLGTIVRRLDFSHYNPTCGGQTARERQQTQNLIPATLRKCLNLTPNLRDFLAQEHIDDELDTAVLTKLMCNLPRLKALDLCACSSTNFRDAFTSVVNSPSLPAILPITRLSLHETIVLPSSVFTTLLPRLPRLTHLDVAHTRITDEALCSIPTTARLTHLNLSRCASLTGPVVVDFLANHPAAQSLVYLNLGMDAKSAEMLSADDLDALLPVLPTTLRSLNLRGSKMSPTHLKTLLPFTKHLEELGLGRHLELSDIESLFLPDQEAPLEEQLSWIPHSLRYIDVSDLSATQLNLSLLFSSSSAMLKSITRPLEVLEVNSDGYKRLEKSPSVKRAGWCVREFGRRYWLVRDPETVVSGSDGQGAASPVSRDSGERPWKIGATFWGMRKVPVARQEVGGMYGLYMFKR